MGPIQERLWRVERNGRQVPVMMQHFVSADRFDVTVGGFSVPLRTGQSPDGSTVLFFAVQGQAAAIVVGVKENEASYDLELGEDLPAAERTPVGTPITIGSGARTPTPASGTTPRLNAPAVVHPKSIPPAPSKPVSLPPAPPEAHPPASVSPEQVFMAPAPTLPTSIPPSQPERASLSPRAERSTIPPRTFVVAATDSPRMTPTQMVLAAVGSIVFLSLVGAFATGRLQSLIRAVFGG